MQCPKDVCESRSKNAVHSLVVNTWESHCFFRTVEGSTHSYFRSTLKSHVMYARLSPLLFCCLKHPKRRYLWLFEMNGVFQCTQLSTPTSDGFRIFCYARRNIFVSQLFWVDVSTRKHEKVIRLLLQQLSPHIFYTIENEAVWSVSWQCEHNSEGIMLYNNPKLRPCLKRLLHYWRREICSEKWPCLAFLLYPAIATFVWKKLLLCRWARNL